MSESYKKEIVQRLTKNLLDIQLLRLIHIRPTWGYQIKKRIETQFNIRLRHGALYPMLNYLERRGFLTSETQQQGGRARKVYTITKEAEEFLQVYYEVLKDQMETKDLS